LADDASSEEVEALMIAVKNLPSLQGEELCSIECPVDGHRTSRGRLLGIITDGDIRRAMQRLGQSFFSTPVSDIMSRNPKTIHKDAKIVEAGEKMNHYSIHTLIVVEPSEVSPQQSVAGVVDSFSCLPGTRFYH
jgi:CBS domain-containing protein